MKIRSVSFDTSFLIKDNYVVDNIIKILLHDALPCFITSTVISEIEQLKTQGQIKEINYKQAIKRWKKSNATLIDFNNNLLFNVFTKNCIKSMEKYHDIKFQEISNDCNILVSKLKDGADLFLCENFQFTLKITNKLIKEISHAACREYYLMCDSYLSSIDTKTFLEAYKDGKIYLDIVKSRLKFVKNNVTKF